ncbi:MAG: Ribose-5-phosphate isomerase A [Methanosaeta sp. PtaB.Bin039]|nr:MAG: Ribose-5-phosphate isomerase A [Methanosaeta sp. PtaB.Bin039]OPY46779.1 MAG: Ribose-5-phosphate isomerase A [Methanosaeta sp. PtaU1.Bin028]HOT07095.1 ribose-5-phosphate isomerase RpiA [Methanotrichaceae archaeon]HQF17040.1 ribose-5-phosphate isomerase RpiA [Methanotrichaceae archaeon]HQI91660.1 ribose-5-phosphate isomerase RpiA [Methanotrichaceae archaeon]
MSKERTPGSFEEEKRAAGESAADLVEDGMVVGLGTGSTVAWTIRRLGRRVGEGLSIQGVATSYQSEAIAISAGIPLTTLSQHPVLDLAIDGADQIDADLNAIKGGGAAHAREKVVAYSARRFVLVSDRSKHAHCLDVAVPIEVLPFSASLARRWLADLGGAPTLRQGRMKDGPVITDNGNFVFDTDFGKITDPEGLGMRISSIPGVVEHGLFTNVDELHVADSGGVQILRRG